MDLAETAPDEALESAQTWADLGGSDPARHCAAVSLMRLGHYEAAGQELETLAGSLAASYAYLQIPILIQAEQAWLAAGKVERAYHRSEARGVGKERVSSCSSVWRLVY